MKLDTNRSQQIVFLRSSPCDACSNLESRFVWDTASDVDGHKDPLECVVPKAFQAATGVFHRKVWRKRVRFVRRHCRGRRSRALATIGRAFSKTKGRRTSSCFDGFDSHGWNRRTCRLSRALFAVPNAGERWIRPIGHSETLCIRNRQKEREPCAVCDGTRAVGKLSRRPVWQAVMANGGAQRTSCTSTASKICC